MATSGPYIHTHQNITNYFTIVSRVNYTHIQHVSIIMFHTCFTTIYNQSHMSVVRPEKFQFMEKGQNCNFDYKIVISVKNP